MGLSDFSLPKPEVAGSSPAGDAIADQCRFAQPRAVRTFTVSPSKAFVICSQTLNLEADGKPGEGYYTWHGEKVTGTHNTAQFKSDAPGEFTVTVSYHLNGKEAEAKAEITVSPALVVWTEGDGQKYGFDDYTNSFEPWKSIEVGKTDFVKATLSPPDAVNDIAFEPDQPSGLIVNPKLPQGVVTNLSVGGANAIGEGNVHPSYKTVEWVPQTLNVATYAKKSRTVVLILVHEQNDDEQKVEFNAIVEPHTLAVKKGANGFLDSVPQGDDKEVEDGITVGKDGRCETNARKNDSPGTDCGMAVFQECLNYYYSQAVFEFKLERGGPITINYDLNRDGKLEMSGRVFSREMKIISDAGMEAHPGFDYYVFLVGGLSEDGVGGIAQAPGKYVFIDAAFSSQANSVEKVIGHELGHAAFGFDENTEDSENLMNRWRGIMLRKPQWDAIQK